jgi:hypothetical protein
MAATPSRLPPWSLALALLLPALAVGLLGNDANWDLQNYHLYGPHAWLHGRAAIDVAPAQWQSYHNPLLDLPMYLLARAGTHPKLIGLWLALPAMASLWLLLRLQSRLSTTPPTPVARAVLALLAVSGAAAWSTLGTSMDDAYVGAALLGSLALVLDEAGAADWRRWLAAGLLAGAITGLKMTAAVYCLALAGTALLGGPMHLRVQRLLALAAGGVAGFLLAYGYWGLGLWQAHGNPFFPYFNQWFRSPDALPIDYMDARFRPQGWLDTVLVPVHLLFRSLRFSEDGLKDPRLLLGLLGFCWLAWRARADAVLRRPLAALCLFFVVTLALWALQSGIYRYAIVLELLGCLALVLCLQRLPRGRAVAMVVALLLVSADTARPDWHRVRSTVAPMPAPVRLPADALVVTASGEPIGYVAAALPGTMPMLGLANNLMAPGRCTRLQRRAEAMLLSHRGPVLLATGEHDPQPPAQALLRAQYGFEARGACLPVRASFAQARLCPQVRVAPAVGACPPR